MTITLVRVGNVLIPKTVSDRWNASVLGIERIPYERNQACIKRLRRELSKWGFTLKVESSRTAKPVWEPTTLEAASLGLELTAQYSNSSAA